MYSRMTGPALETPPPITIACGSTIAVMFASAVPRYLPKRSATSFASSSSAFTASNTSFAWRFSTSRSVVCTSVSANSFFAKRTIPVADLSLVRGVFVLCLFLIYSLRLFVFFSYGTSIRQILKPLVWNCLWMSVSYCTSFCPLLYDLRPPSPSLPHHCLRHRPHPLTIHAESQWENGH